MAEARINVSVMDLHVVKVMWGALDFIAKGCPEDVAAETAQRALDDVHALISEGSL